ncbi:hypothetical protein MLD38_007899 [Melastoma candidum]|uniref:Uncharacterized protein n=1 Tax=Melastoma candidum TaxID=119954 RepID=A0ACB9RWX3_9MYRT|nr:hypothetical protein MLD38_007899 [Melastoma candidum]
MNAAASTTATVAGDAASPSRRDTFAIGDRLFTATISLVGMVQAFVLSLSRCFDFPFGRPRLAYSYEQLSRIAHRSPFTVNEVEALLDLYKKLSGSVIDDGLLQKEELKLALFRTQAVDSLFLDRVFDIFDEKQNGVIEFEEFVHALAVFHPLAPVDEKINFAFRLYDPKQTGFIERDEVRKMVIATLLESSIHLSNEALESILENTFAGADVDKDGRISKEEWIAFVLKHPSLLKIFTVDHLRNITAAFPSFIFNTEVED